MSPPINRYTGLGLRVDQFLKAKNRPRTCGPVRTPCVFISGQEHRQN
jgi:hypothetical protein